MPSYLRGQERNLEKFVLIYQNGDLYYGFNTKDFTGLTGYGITDAEITALGHLNLDGVPDNGIVIIRANSPKPARVKKRINRNPGVNQIGYASTFVAAGSLATAAQEGWKFAQQGRGISLSQSSRTTTAMADLSSNEGLYAAPMNTADFEGSFEPLGLKSKATITDQERQRIFTGASRPRPPVVSRVTDTGGEFQSNCSASALEQALANDQFNFQLKRAEIAFG